MVKHILTAEECRSVGKTGGWWDELAVTIALKPPSVLQETLDVLAGDALYGRGADLIKSKLCSKAGMNVNCSIRSFV